MPEPLPPSAPPSLHDRLAWARSVTSRYGGPAARAAGEPVLLELNELTAVLERAVREGTPAELGEALPLADVLGAAWERLGEYVDGRARLDAVLAAATRAGLRDELDVARVLRRRARLAMGARFDDEADEDLARAYAIAACHDDDQLVLSLLIDRADLTMHRGDWERAVEVVPELLRRTEATGDPLLQAMGLNRAGWSAFGQGEHVLARQRYERSRQLAELHEDPVVESRTASGLGLLAMLEGDHRTARASWRRALQLAEQVHDRTFTLMCLDGIAALLALEGAEGAARLDASVTAVRESLGRPREEGLRGLHDLVLRHGGDPGAPWSYAEAVAFSRRAVAEPT